MKTLNKQEKKKEILKQMDRHDALWNKYWNQQEQDSLPSPQEEQGWEAGYEKWWRSLGQVGVSEFNPATVKGYIRYILSERDRKLRERIEKLKVKTSSGGCPSCNRPTISGLHPYDTDEHFPFYNQALDDILSDLEKTD